MDDNEWSIATQMISASDFAAQRATALLDQGDVPGAAAWARVGHAINALNAGDATHQESPESLFENYADYNRALRGWFVTFGLGGPALFLVEPELANQLKSDDALGWVILPFLAGCASQIFIALINKIYGFHAYDAAGRRPPAPIKEPWRTIGKWFWLDVGCDVFTIVAFTIAIWVLLDTLVI